MKLSYQLFSYCAEMYLTDLLISAAVGASVVVLAFLPAVWSRINER